MRLVFFYLCVRARDLWHFTWAHEYNVSFVSQGTNNRWMFTCCLNNLIPSGGKNKTKKTHKIYSQIKKERALLTYVSHCLKVCFVSIRHAVSTLCWPRDHACDTEKRTDYERMLTRWKCSKIFVVSALVCTLLCFQVRNMFLNHHQLPGVVH